MGKRFSTYLPINQPNEFVSIIVNDFFAKEGFVYTNYKGEMVWKRGNGVLAAPQFVKLDYQNGTVYLQAWVKYALLPGVYVCEMDLDGGFCFPIKNMLKNRVDALMSLLAQQVNTPVPQPQMAYAGAVEGQTEYAEPVQNGQPTAQQQYPNTQNVTPIAVHNPTSKATLSLIMGLVSIVSWLIPIAGVVTTIIGISTAIPGMKSTAKGKAIAGLVLSIVFLVVTILYWIGGIILDTLSF